MNKHGFKNFLVFRAAFFEIDAEVEFFCSVEFHLNCGDVTDFFEGGKLIVRNYCFVVETWAREFSLGGSVFRESREDIIVESEMGIARHVRFATSSLLCDFEFYRIEIENDFKH